MSGRSSREKGKRWEKALASMLQALGFHARRLSGARGEADILIQLNGWEILIEAKHYKRADWRSAWNQAQDSVGNPEAYRIACCKDDRNDPVWLFPDKMVQEKILPLLMEAERA